MDYNRRIIINADDCGKSQIVDTYIENAIMKGIISSTTIMANMADFDGAVRLYRQYHKEVSFGWHINLDEGEPLTKSQLLLDTGFYIEKDGAIQLNGMAFRNKFFNKEMRYDINKELRTQWVKIRDNGIEITHADSHHYIHTQPSMIQILPSLFQDLNIKRCRCIANYGISGLNGLVRNVWTIYYKKRGLRMPDTFCSFNTYASNRFKRQGQIIELMCHPGHPDYQREYELLMNTNLDDWNSKLITYKEI